MNWIKNFIRPRIQTLLGGKREVAENMWVKCPETGEMVFYRDLEANLFVIPASGYHMRMPPDVRLKTTFDDGAYEKIAMPTVPADPLKFRDERKYADRIKEARTKNGVDDCIQVGVGELEGFPVTIAVQDFAFMGGSLGMAAGEAIITAMRKAVEKKTPVIFFISSGGARMQEGLLSLMQMAKTTAALTELGERELPFISVLTDPTTGGVSASYAFLGDVVVAEPKALIGFAGPRVIEQTVRQKLPEGFQRSEFLLEKGAIDMVIDRRQMRDKLAVLLALLQGMPAESAN